MGCSGMPLLPESSSDFQRIDLQVLPPGNLAAGLMELAMMATTERHGELVTDLEPDRPRLRKTIGQRKQDPRTPCKCSSMVKQQPSRLMTVVGSVWFRHVARVHNGEGTR
jgi:hypothetical protein